MFGDTLDKGCVKIGGERCVSDRVCFWRKNMGWILVEKCTPLLKVDQK